jgi:hypothetical protein
LRGTSLAFAEKVFIGRKRHESYGRGQKVSNLRGGINPLRLELSIYF